MENYTRMTLDIPRSLHRTIKTVASSEDKTIKDLMISAVEKYIRSKMNKKSTSEETMDLLLKPLIEDYLKDIDENGSNNFISLSEFENEE